MGPLRAGQELRSCQRVELMTVESTMQRPSRHRALGPKILWPRLELPEA